MDSYKFTAADEASDWELEAYGRVLGPLTQALVEDVMGHLESQALMHPRAIHQFRSWLIGYYKSSLQLRLCDVPKDTDVDQAAADARAVCYAPKPANEKSILEIINMAQDFKVETSSSLEQTAQGDFAAKAHAAEAEKEIEKFLSAKPANAPPAWSFGHEMMAGVAVPARSANVKKSPFVVYHPAHYHYHQALVSHGGEVVVRPEHLDEKTGGIGVTDLESSDFKTVLLTASGLRELAAKAKELRWVDNEGCFLIQQKPKKVVQGCEVLDCKLSPRLQRWEDGDSEELTITGVEDFELVRMGSVSVNKA